MLNFVYNNYFPKEVVDELISSKNKEIDWLKIEIKNLKQERETLLQMRLCQNVGTTSFIFYSSAIFSFGY
ncbi:hypothetical protein GA246_26645, partial [Bacteroides xylanisolvens]